MPAVRKHLGTIIGIAISLAALALAVRGLPLAETWSVVAGGNYWYVLPATAALLISFIARAIRWRGLLQRRVQPGEAWHAMNAGYLLNNLLPFRLGELARAYLLSRSRSVAAAEVLSTIAAERVLDLLSAVVIIAITLPLVAPTGWMRSAGLSAGVVGVVGMVVLILAAHYRPRFMAVGEWVVGRLPRLSGLLGRVLAQADIFLIGLQPLRDWRLLGVAVFWSAVVWVVSGLVNWMMLYVVLPHPPLVLGYYVLGVAAVAYAVPSSPGQAGVLEAAVVAALRPLGVAQSSAFSYAVLMHSLSYSYTILFGSWALSHYGETLAGLARSAQTLLSRRKPAVVESTGEV